MSESCISCIHFRDQDDRNERSPGSAKKWLPIPGKKTFAAAEIGGTAVAVIVGFCRM